MKYVRMQLGDPAVSGQLIPITIAGSDSEVEASTIIVVISQEPALESVSGLRVEEGFLKAEEWRATRNTALVAAGSV